MVRWYNALGTLWITEADGRRKVQTSKPLHCRKITLTVFSNHQTPTRTPEKTDIGYWTSGKTRPVLNKDEDNGTKVAAPHFTIT